MTMPMIELQTRNDARGRLTVLEGNTLPFPIKRVFAISDVPEGAQRGGHAHREQWQAIVILQGSVRLRARTGSSDEHIILDRPNLCFIAAPMTWIDLGEFHGGAVCVVFCSDTYSESDYVRNWSEFESLLAGGI
jgi:tellurite resistance-related uncharacterized protein